MHFRQSLSFVSDIAQAKGNRYQIKLARCKGQGLGINLCAANADKRGFIEHAITPDAQHRLINIRKHHVPSIARALRWRYESVERIGPDLLLSLVSP